MNRENVDLESVERLLAELESDMKAAKQAKRAKKLGLDAAVATSPAPSAEVVVPSTEYNPYATSFVADQRLAVEVASPTKTLPRKPAFLAPLAAPPTASAATAPPPADVQEIRDIVAEQLKAQTKGAKKKKSKRTAKRTDSGPTDDVALGDNIQTVLHSQTVLSPPGSFVPASRFDHTAVVVHGSRVVVFGGVVTAATTGKPTVSMECVEFDAASSAWDPITPSRGEAPKARSLHVAAAVDLDRSNIPRYVVIHGGRTMTGEALDDVHLFDATNQAWTAVSPTEGQRWPQARWGHTASAFQHKMYIFGGRFVKAGEAADDRSTAQQPSSKQHLANDVWSFDAKRQRWFRLMGNFTPVAPPQGVESSSNADDGAVHGPCKRQRHAMCIANDGTNLFVHGGFDASGAALNDLWKFDIASHSWSEISRAGNSVPRARHAMVYVHERLVLVGGIVQASGDASRVSTIASLGPAEDAWTMHVLIGDATSATRASASVSLALGNLLVIGGTNSSSDVHPSQQQRLQTTSVGVVWNWRGSLDTCRVGSHTLGGLAQAHVGNGAPFDSVISFEDGSQVGFHRSLLACRAPELDAALKTCETVLFDPAVATPPLVTLPGALAYVVNSTRRRAGLTRRVTRASFAALLQFVYTGTIDDAEGSEASDALDQIARDYNIRDALSLLETLRGGEDNRQVARVAAALQSEELMRGSLQSMCGDVMSSDCTIVVGRDDRTSVAVDAHLAVVMAGCPVFKRFVTAASLQWAALFGMRETKATASTTTNSPARSTVQWNEEGTQCSDKASGLELVVRSPSSHSDSETVSPSRISIRCLSTVDDTTLQHAGFASQIRLPAASAALRVALDFMYTGSVSALTPDNAVDVLVTAKSLKLPLLGAAAERILAFDLETTEHEVPPSVICALLHLGVRYAAQYVLSRGSVAAAQNFIAVSAEDSFTTLPPLLKSSIERMAAQWGLVAQTLPSS